MLALAYSAKAIARLGKNMATMNLMNGGPYPKNNMMRSLLRGSQMVCAMTRVKTRKAEAKVEGSVVMVVVAEEVLEGVLGTEMCPSLTRS